MNRLLALPLVAAVAVLAAPTAPQSRAITGPKFITLAGKGGGLVSLQPFSFEGFHKTNVVDVSTAARRVLVRGRCAPIYWPAGGAFRS